MVLKDNRTTPRIEMAKASDVDMLTDGNPLPAFDLAETINASGLGNLNHLWFQDNTRLKDHQTTSTVACNCPVSSLFTLVTVYSLSSSTKVSHLSMSRSGRVGWSL